MTTIHISVPMYLHQVITCCNCEDVNVLGFPSKRFRNSVADGGEFGAKTVDELAGDLERR